MISFFAEMASVVKQKISVKNKKKYPVIFIIINLKWELFLTPPHFDLQTILYLKNYLSFEKE